MVVNSRRTLAHLTVPATITPRADDLLASTRRLPTQTTADHLLTRLAPELAELKADQESVDRMRERLTPRQPLTMALRARLEEKNQKIRQLEAELARKTTSHSNAVPDAPAEADDKNMSAVLPLEADLCPSSRPIPSPPRTPPNERPFAVSPMKRSAHSFLVNAACYESAEEAEARVQAAEEVAALRAAAEAATAATAATTEVAPGRGIMTNPDQPLTIETKHRPYKARSLVRSSAAVELDVSEARRRARAAAAAADVASSEAMAKALHAEAVRGCDTTALSAESAWATVTKAPREAAAAAKTAAAAREEAESAAFDARRVELVALSSHHNEHVRRASAVPAAALDELATQVHDERTALKQHSMTIGEALWLRPKKPQPASSRGGAQLATILSFQVPGAELPQPFAERMNFSSEMSPMTLTAYSPIRQRSIPVRAGA